MISWIKGTYKLLYSYLIFFIALFGFVVLLPVSVLIQVPYWTGKFELVIGDNLWCSRFFVKLAGDFPDWD